jgi:hypothetical protein
MINNTYRRTHALRSLSLAIFLVLSHMDLVQAAESVDDKIVRRWILTSLSENANQGQDETKLNELLKKRRLSSKVDVAWGSLKGCRDSGKSLDLNLAAAEHYMFMRLQSSQTGDTVFRKMPVLYYFIKRAAEEIHTEAAMQTTQQPISPSNADVTHWGDEGVEEGLKDYKDQTGNNPTYKTGAVAEAVGLAIYLYIKGPLTVKSVCEIATPRDIAAPLAPTQLQLR